MATTSLNGQKVVQAAGVAGWEGEGSLLVEINAGTSLGSWRSGSTDTTRTAVSSPELPGRDTDPPNPDV